MLGGGGSDSPTLPASTFHRDRVTHGAGTLRREQGDKHIVGLEPWGGDRVTNTSGAPQGNGGNTQSWVPEEGLG